VDTEQKYVRTIAHEHLSQAHRQIGDTCDAAVWGDLYLKECEALARLELNRLQYLGKRIAAVQALTGYSVGDSIALLGLLAHPGVIGERPSLDINEIG